MTRRYRRRRFYRPYHYRVGMSYNYGSSYSTYGAVQYEDDILLPSSSGRFTNLGTAPVDGNGIVNIKSSAFTSPTQLNFNYSAAAYPAELKKRLNSQEWIAIQKELNQVLIDYPVDYQGFASVTYSEFVWCLLFLLGIIPYCILNSQYSNKKREIRQREGARENALSVKVDEMNLKYKSKGIVMEAGDNACWVEVKMMKRYQIVCPPSAAYPNMVTTRIRLANGTTANVTVPVPKNCLPGQTFQAMYTPGESTMVLINQPMFFQAEVPPTSERTCGWSSLFHVSVLCHSNYTRTQVIQVILTK